MMGGLLPLRENVFAANKPTTYPVTVMSSPRPEIVTTPFRLDPGSEIHWQAQTAHVEPGQVTQGTGMIGPDGTVVLGPYGTCNVGGMTLDRANRVVEQHLASYLDTPTVRLSAVVTTDQAAPTLRADLAWRGTAWEPTTRPAQGFAATQGAGVRQATWGQTTARQPETIIVSPETAASQSSGQFGDGTFLRRVFSRLGFGQP
jgi:hypothetical protein